MNVYADLLARAMYDPGDQGYGVQVFDGDPTKKREVVSFLRYKVHDHGFYSWFPENVQVSGPNEHNTDLHVFTHHKLLGYSSWSFPIEDLLESLRPVGDTVDPRLASATTTTPAVVQTGLFGALGFPDGAAEDEDRITRTHGTLAPPEVDVHGYSFASGLDGQTITPVSDISGTSGRGWSRQSATPYEASGRPETSYDRRRTP